MNKRKLHHIWTKIRLIKPWYFLGLALISALVCVFALRDNNQQMVTLRNAVYAADRDNGDVQKALKDLQAYVTSHMNTDLSVGNGVYPPIQLKYTYERLVKAQQQSLLSGNELYTAAQQYCEQQNPTGVSGGSRVPCIEQYIQSRGTGQQQKPAIPDALYKFSFASPTWSPDLAGWSMLLSILSFGAFVISFIAHRWFKHYLH